MTVDSRTGCLIHFKLIGGLNRCLLHLIDLNEACAGEDAESNSWLRELPERE